MWLELLKNKYSCCRVVKKVVVNMNNFYDDCFDMVPYEKPNLAVQQLAVNANGGVTVESTLQVMGPVLAQGGLTLSSDGTSSHVFMKGSGHPGHYW